MNEEGEALFTPQPKIHNKIRIISSALAQVEEFGNLTTPQLIELLHWQIRELARICHQLSHLHSEKGGDD